MCHPMDLLIRLNLPLFAMITPITKPRLTRPEDVSILVRHLRREGLAGRSLVQRMTEIGPVDLDILARVLRVV